VDAYIEQVGQRREAHGLQANDLHDAPRLFVTGQRPDRSDRIVP
jgi:hypothetical protein